MLIGLDASRLNLKEKTGVEWYTYHLIKGLAELDVSNRYLLYTSRKLTNYSFNLPNNFQEKVLWWPFKKYWTLGRLSLEMIFEKPDLLFIPSHTLPLISGKKNIITWHDLAYEYYPKYYRKSNLWSLKFGAKRMAQKADKIITVSNFSKKELIKFYHIPADKIEVIYLGYDPAVYNLKRIKLIKPSKYQPNKPYISYIGRIEEKKNLANLIEAFKILKEKYQSDLQLVLIGPLGYRSEIILNKISNSIYKNDIKLFGWLSLDDKLKILSASELFVFPSNYEGFGLPIIEAMALKIPVVASRIEALMEIGGRAVNYFSPNNFYEMPEVINRVLTNQGLKNHLIKNGQERVKNLTWRNCCQKTLKVINSV